MRFGCRTADQGLTMSAWLRWVGSADSVVGLQRSGATWQAPLQSDGVRRALLLSRSCHPLTTTSSMEPRTTTPALRYVMHVYGSQKSGSEGTSMPSTINALTIGHDHVVAKRRLRMKSADRGKELNLTFCRALGALNGPH